MQYSFGAGKSVNHNFNAADKYYAESPEDQGMKEAKHGASEYLSLTEGNPHHDIETLAEIFNGECGLCKSEELDQAVNGIEKYSESNQKCNCKYNLFSHSFILK
jgi:hypothetical protein